MLRHASIVAALAACAAAQFFDPSSLDIRRLSKRATIQVPLGEVYTTTDIQWYTTISVGTPPQNLTVVIDTGSLYLLLPRNNCTTCGNATNFFDPSKSTTFSDQPFSPQSFHYGTGATEVPDGDSAATLSGTVVRDTVTIGGLTITNQTFLLEDIGALSVESIPVDGILGMPPVDATSLGGNATGFGSPVFFNLNATGQMASPVFALSLNSASAPGPDKGGEMTLGGLDNSKYSGNISYVNLNHTIAEGFGEWILFVGGAAVNGNASILSGALPEQPSVALVDTGTAYIAAPDFNSTKALYAAISPDIVQIDPNGAWGAPCDVLSKLSPVVSFELVDEQGNAVTVTVDKTSFNLGPYPGLKDTCQAVFVNSLEAVFPGVNFWTLGSPLLKTYYTVWDAGNLRVGFANRTQSAAGGGSGNGTASGGSGGGAGPGNPTASGAPPSGTSVPGNSGGMVRAGSSGLLAAALAGLILL